MVSWTVEGGGGTPSADALALVDDAAPEVEMVVEAAVEAETARAAADAEEEACEDRLESSPLEEALEVSLPSTERRADEEWRLLRCRAADS